MKALVDFTVKSVRTAYDLCIAPNLRLYGRVIEGTAEFLLRTVPQSVSGVLDKMETQGINYCSGPKAYKSMPLGIFLRDTARAGMLPFKNIFFMMGLHAGSLIAGGVAAKMILAPALTGVAAVAAGAVGGIAFFPLVSALALVAAPAVLCLAGAFAAAPCALMNLDTGRKVTREWREARQRAEKPRPLTHFEVEGLPALERAFYYQLDKIAEAPAHERVQWLEGMKNRFPEDFARAAVLGADELGTKLKHQMQVKKKPLKVKKPQRTLAKKIGGVFGRS